MATRATLWFHNSCNMRKKCCVANASKNVARVAAALLRIRLVIINIGLLMDVNLALISAVHPWRDNPEISR